ncbi:hypothetical protein [Nevskia sp.]|uniref:hypothetical protein n=1 Tax=Nevskia sp. TaxID=1929292 RepID=UPI0025E028DA|nr:hypothetical protein [Nevskia sp.]
MSLLSGRQLVEELARLGLGTWTPDAVRQWIREEPPCPIAEAADQGKPHRYRLVDVLAWLQARAERERSKGFSSASTVQMVDRIALVLRNVVSGVTTAEPRQQLPLDALPLAPAPADLLAPSRTGNFTVDEIEGATDLDLVMKVLQGRDATAWKRVEEALAARRKRLEADGLVIPVDELQQTLDVQAVAMRSASNALVIPLAQRIPDSSTFAQREAIIQTAIDRMLEGLSRGGDDADDLVPA